MKRPSDDEERDLLFQAFRAGWQAALAVHITNPRVLAVLESCFEGWLLEATDEVEVFGLAFRRREDLPHLVRTRAPERARGDEPADQPQEPAPPGIQVAAFEGRHRSGTPAVHPAT